MTQQRATSSTSPPPRAEESSSPGAVGDEKASPQLIANLAQLKKGEAPAADPYGCEYINAYCRRQHKGAFLCSHLKAKGRILTANRDYEEGELLFEEPPLHIVHEEEENALHALKEGINPFSLAFLCAEDLAASRCGETGRSLLRCITRDQQYKLLLLYHGEVTEASDDVVHLVEELGLVGDGRGGRDDGGTAEQVEMKPQEVVDHRSADDEGGDPGVRDEHRMKKSRRDALALLLERLLQVWILNCFEHSESPLGYSTYFMSSFMSHSCFPNVVWHYKDDSLFVLRARRQVRKGDEICCSYLAEEALLESAPSRRQCIAGSDFSRGFLCPWCKIGTLFPPVGLEREAFYCNRCQKFDWETEWSRLERQEKELEKLFKSWETQIEKSNKQHGGNLGTVKALSSAKISAALEAVSTLFSQHWLQDRFWNIAQEFYDQSKNWERATHYARLRINFHRFAYSGVNGAHAWAMETLGELLFKTSKQSEDIYQNRTMLKKYLNESISEFDEALRILETMFGEGHEYCETVNSKRHRVVKRLDAILAMDRGNEESEASSRRSDRRQNESATDRIGPPLIVPGSSVPPAPPSEVTATRGHLDKFRLYNGGAGGATATAGGSPPKAAAEGEAAAKSSSSGEDESGEEEDSEQSEYDATPEDD
eukprot:g10701.t1